MTSRALTVSGLSHLGQPRARQTVTRVSSSYIPGMPGKHVVCVTPYGEEFGERRLTEILIRNARRPLEELVTVVNEAASAWGSAAEQQDDMTLLLLRRL